MIENKLKVLRPKDYCLRMVLKMCFYLQKIHEIEILQMNADFFQDDNGEIWFFYASDVLTKPQIKSQLEQKQEEQIKEAYKLKLEKRAELKKLDHAEWKDYQKRLKKEEESRRNVFKEQLSKLGALKKQRKIKKQQKEDRTEQIKEMGK